MPENLDLVSLQDVEEIVKSMGRKLRGRVREAYIFGSVVEGLAVRGESDLDLIVVPVERGRVDLFELLREEIEALLDLGVPLDLMIADNVTYRHVLEEARRKGVRIA